MARKTLGEQLAQEREARLAAEKRADEAEARQGPALKVDPADRPAQQLAERTKIRIGSALAKWAPALVAGAIAGGVVVLVTMGGHENAKGVTSEDQVENNFFDLIAHLPTIGLILVIALIADYLAKYVMSRRWFDEHGSARELGTIRERVGTPQEKAQDGLAAGLGFVGNRLFAAAVAGALLLHFG